VGAVATEAAGRLRTNANDGLQVHPLYYLIASARGSMEHLRGREDEDRTLRAVERLKMQFQAQEVLGVGNEFNPTLNLKSFSIPSATAETLGLGPGNRLPEATNVVIIVLESFGAASIEARPGIAPALEDITARGIDLRSHFGSYNSTDTAAISILFSMHAPVSFSRIEPDRFKAELESLPMVLRRQGYSTTVLADGYFTLRKVFDRVLSPDSLLPRASRSSFGVSDEALFEVLPDVIEQAAKPAYVQVFTLSSHWPWSVPDDFQRDHPEIADWLDYEKALFLTDHYLGRFLERAATRPWFRDTLFVFVGDHVGLERRTARLGLDEIDLGSLREHFRVRAGFFHPGLRPMRIESDTSHVQLAPTILSLLGVTAITDFVGRSIFDERADPFVVSAEDSRGLPFVLHNPQKAIFRSPGGEWCVVIDAGLEAAPHPCSEDEGEVSAEYLDTFVDTFEWEVSHLADGDRRR
jgi:hypothetical protein